MIRVKRVYDRPEPTDGARLLVERLWPRGVKKEALQMTDWLKEVTPSDALRRWFGHDPAKWEEFQRRYFAELDSRPGAWQPIVEAARRGHVTFLYSARDPEHNSAIALKAYVENALRGTNEQVRGSRPRQAGRVADPRSQPARRG
jgi:uncharacterized protein YeaO (DUF488 family)